MVLSQFVRLTALLLALQLFTGPGSALAEEDAAPQAAEGVDAEIGGDAETGDTKKPRSKVQVEASPVGPYIQGGLVQAWIQLNRPEDFSSLGIDLTLGARIHRYMALEVGYEGIFGWDTEIEETSTYAIMASAKAYFPLAKIGPIRSIQPFAVAGVGTLISLQGKDHIARFAYRLGLGVDLLVTDSVYLSLTYRYTGNLDSFGYTNLLYGVGYHFY